MKTAILTVAIIALAACSDGTGPNEVELEILAIDSVTAAPAVGVGVLVNGHATTLDGEGRAALRLAPGAYTVTFESERFEQVSRQFDLGPDSLRLILVLRRLAPAVHHVGFAAGEVRVTWWDLQGDFEDSLDHTWLRVRTANGEFGPSIHPTAGMLLDPLAPWSKRYEYPVAQLSYFRAYHTDASGNTSEFDCTPSLVCSEVL